MKIYNILKFNVYYLMAIYFFMMLNGCTDKNQIDTKYNDSTTEQQIGKTNQLITLKGIPFGQPNFKAELKKICLEENTDALMPEYVCMFEEDNVVWGFFSYGNIPVRGSNATLIFDKEGALHYFKIKWPNQNKIEINTILEDKYGRPKLEVQQISIGIGEKINTTNFSWVDEKGTSIFFQPIDESDFRLGSLSIISQKMSDSIIEKILIDRKNAKENL